MMFTWALVLTHRGARAGLAATASAERQPVNPIACGQQLLGTRPEFPKIGKQRRFLRREPRDEIRARLFRQLGEVGGAKHERVV
jgi:hypothetical protein